VKLTKKPITKAMTEETTYHIWKRSVKINKEIIVTAAALPPEKTNFTIFL
jgi:hypothetical protein